MTYHLSTNGTITAHDSRRGLGKAIADALLTWSKLSVCPTHGNETAWGCRHAVCMASLKASNDADRWRMANIALPYSAVLPGNDGIGKLVLSAWVCNDDCAQVAQTALLAA